MFLRTDLVRLVWPLSPSSQPAMLLFEKYRIASKEIQEARRADSHVPTHKALDLTALTEKETGLLNEFIKVKRHYLDLNLRLRDRGWDVLTSVDGTSVDGTTYTVRVTRPEADVQRERDEKLALRYKAEKKFKDKCDAIQAMARRLGQAKLKAIRLTLPADLQADLENL